MNLDLAHQGTEFDVVIQGKVKEILQQLKI